MILRSEYNFIKSLAGRSHISRDEAYLLKEIYGKYVNPVRVKVLDHTCGPCVAEMYVDTLKYISDPNIKINENI